MQDRITGNEQTEELAHLRAECESLQGAVLSLRAELAQRDQAAAALQALARFPDEDPNPVLRIAANGSLLYANSASQPLLGRWGARVGEAPVEGWPSPLAEALAGGRPPAARSIDVQCDGRIISFHVVPVAAPGPDPEAPSRGARRGSPGARGEAGYANLYGRDVTEVREARVRLEHLAEEAQAARDEAERHAAELDAVLSAVPVAVAIYGPTGEIERMNSAVQALFAPAPGFGDLPVEQRMEVRPSTWPDGRRIPKEEQPVTRALKGEAVRDEMMAVYTPDRKAPLWIQASAASLHAPNGDITGAAVSFTDVTELRTAQQQLQDANEELRVRAEQLEASQEELRVVNAQLRLSAEQLETARGEAEQRAAELDAAFASMPAGAVMYNAQGDIVRLNLRAEAVLGRSPGLVEASRDKRLQAAPLTGPDGRPVAVNDRPLERALRGETVRDTLITMYLDPTPIRLMVGMAPIYGAAAHLPQGGAEGSSPSDGGASPSGERQLLGVVASFVDVTNLHDSQERLEAANEDLAAERARLQTILDYTPAAIVVTDAQARVLFTNRLADGIYVRPVPYGQEYSSHAAMQLCHPDGTPYDPRDLPLTRSALDGETLTDVEMAIVWPDGQRRELLVNTVPVRDAEGRVTGTVGAFQDITPMNEAARERERLLAEVESERALLDAILEHLPVGIFVAEAPSGRLIRVSEQAHHIWRMSSMEADKVSEYSKFPGFYPDGRKYASEDWQLAKALRGQEIRGEEVEIIRGDGTRGVMRSGAAPVRDRDGNVVAAVVVIDDITLLHETRQQLEATNEELQARGEQLGAQNQELQRLLIEVRAARDETNRRAAELDAVFEAIPDGLVLYRPDAEIVRSNEIAKVMFHLSPDVEHAPLDGRLQVIKSASADGGPVTPESSPVTRALAGETVSNEIMAVTLAGRDEPLWISVSAVPLRSASGTLPLRSASGTLPLRSASGTLPLRSASGTLPLRSASGTFPLRSGSPLDGNPSAPSLGARRGTSRGAFPLRGPGSLGGPITGAVMSATDISRLRATQGELESANEQLEAARDEATRRAAELDAVFAVLPHSLIVFEPDGRVRRSNQAAKTIYSLTPVYERTPVTERVATRIYAGPDGRILPLEQTPLGRALRGETVLDQIMSLRVTPDGPPTWLSVSAAPMLGLDGEIAGVVSASTEITTLKTAQEQAERRAAELDAVFATMLQGVILFDREGRIIRANHAAEAMLGLTPTNNQAPMDERVRVRGVSGPDGRLLALHEVPGVRALAGEMVPNAMLTVQVPGQDRPTWISTSAAPLRGPTGEIIGAVLSCADITELHEAQERLEQTNTELAVRGQELQRQAEELKARNEDLGRLSAQLEAERVWLQAILQQMPAGLSIAEVPSGKIVLRSEYVHRIFAGHLPEGAALPGYTIARGYYPDGRPYRPEDWPLARALATGETVQDEEMDIERADGTRGTLVVSAGPIRGSDGRMTAAVCTFLDVTERKAMEEALRRSEERYRAFIEHSSEAIWRLELEEPIPVTLPEDEQIRLLYSHGYVAECNEALARLHGFDHSSEVVGRRLGQIVPRLSPDNLRYVTSFIRFGYHVDSAESIEVGRQGETRYYLNSLVGSIDADRGTLVRLWGVQRDLTERKTMENDLRCARDELDVRVQERTAELAHANEELEAREEEARRRAEYAEALATVAARLSTSLELDGVLRAVCEETARVLHVSAVSGAVCSDESNEFDAVFHVGVPEAIATRLRPAPRAYYEDILTRSGSMLVVEDIQTRCDSPNFDFLINCNVCSLVGCTMLHDGRPIGGLNVYVFDEVRHFSPEELALLRGLADQAALAVANARLYQQLRLARDELERRVEERTRELGTVLALSAQITSNLALEPMLAGFVGSLRGLVDYTSLSIYRLEDDELAAVEYQGPGDREEILQVRVSLERSGGLMHVLAERRPIIVPDMAAPEGRGGPDWRADADARLPSQAAGVRSWLGLPLMVRDRLIGVAALTHEQPDHFSPRDAELALAYANHAAVAMENARLVDQAKELAAMQERQRLARDLHDLVSQTLFSASLTADVLPKLYTRDPVHGAKLLDDLRRMNRGALAELRALLVELRPQALLEADLGTLLTQLAEAAAGRSNTSISVIKESVCPVPGDIQVALYRITQEALHNVAKHAKAEESTVRLRCTPCTPGPDASSPSGGGKASRVELSITDDGIGFDLARVPANQFGLSIMRERAAAIGAVLEIETAPGKGTLVSVTWPAG